MNRDQNALWTAILASYALSIGQVETSIGDAPLFADEIEDRHLYVDGAVFQRVVFRSGFPRIASVRREGGVAVALAILTPTTVDHCGCPLVPGKVGSKAGLVGVYVAPEHRGKGYARECVRAVAKTLQPTLVQLRQQHGIGKFCMTAEQRIVRWCQDLFAIEVVARMDNQREPHQQISRLSSSTIRRLHRQSFA